MDIIDKRILVVEDEYLIFMMIEDILSDLGCKSISSVATVEQAIIILNEQVFDVVILDQNLNGVSSKPIAKILSDQKIPFFYSTGNTIHKDYHGPLVLKKPFTHENLVFILSKVLNIV